MKRLEDLSRPRARRTLGVHYDPDAFGRFSEAIARLLGTARFLVIQTCIVIAWIILNVTWIKLRWDKYPFILLNLAFSTQAAYAAPLILLAQNRQADRDRAEADADRDLNFRTQADTDYLAREVASVRLALNDVATADDLRRSIESLTEAVERIETKLSAGNSPGPGTR